MGLDVSFPGGAVVFVEAAHPRGRVAGLAGPDVSKTEEIKAPAAWISPRNPAMIRCFRCRAA